MKKHNTCRRTNAQKNHVILNLIQDLAVQIIKAVRFQIKFGMTPLFNNGGFTLIELLVVDLIFGILAAVALPQYQQAVLKSRFAAMIPVVDSLAQAERLYYQENGTYTTNLSLLDVTPPKNMPPSVSFSAWFNSNQTSGVIRGEYSVKIQYLRNIMGKGSRECRANQNNALAVAICASYGEYINTYGSYKAYRM